MYYLWKVSGLDISAGISLADYGPSDEFSVFESWKLRFLCRKDYAGTTLASASIPPQSFFNSSKMVRLDRYLVIAALLLLEVPMLLEHQQEKPWSQRSHAVSLPAAPHLISTPLILSNLRASKSVNRHSPSLPNPHPAFPTPPSSRTRTASKQLVPKTKPTTTA